MFLDLDLDSDRLDSTMSLVMITKHTHTQLFYGPFSGTTRVSRRQKKSSSGLYDASEDNRGKHANNPAGHQSMQTNQRPPP